MKKKYIFTLAALVSLSLTGCSKFLDVQPEGVPTEDNYFQFDEQAENSIKSLYAPLYGGDDGFGREIYWEQCAGNMMVPGKQKGWTSTLLTMKYTGDESPLTDCYKLLMQLQSRANWIVDALLQKEKAEKTLSTVMKRSLGEAFFMRGFLHFMIAYRYGTNEQGVPAVKYEEWREEHGAPYNSKYEIPKQQENVMVNYDMIIKDFEKAKEYLPRFETYGPDERGRAHQAAAVGMEARVYAYWATWDKTKWNDVIKIVDLLENEYGRGLAPTFSKLFGVDWNPGENGWWGPEYIWSFPSNGGAGWQRGGIEWTGVVLENTGWGVYNGWGQNKPTLDAYREFIKDGVDSTKNERLYKSILQYNQEFTFPTDKTLKEVKVWHYYSATVDTEAGFQINKWMEPWSFPNCVADGYVNSSGDWPTSRCNFHVLRFADALLLRAEAYLNSPDRKDEGKAMADINKVRARVNLDAITRVSMENIYHERFCELAYEPASDHFADLKRWAVSGDATIKALAIKELTKHPDVRHYLRTSDPESPLDPQYDYETEGGSPYLDESMKGKEWADYKIVFPYPSNEITKSAGALKQNKGY